jgi:hypothetical protein
MPLCSGLRNGKKKNIKKGYLLGYLEYAVLLTRGSFFLRNEYLNSKPGRETEAAQEMDSVTS